MIIPIYMTIIHGTEAKEALLMVLQTMKYRNLQQIWMQ